MAPRNDFTRFDEEEFSRGRHVSHIPWRRAPAHREDSLQAVAISPRLSPHVRLNHDDPPPHTCRGEPRHVPAPSRLAVLHPFPRDEDVSSESSIFPGTGNPQKDMKHGNAKNADPARLAGHGNDAVILRSRLANF